VCLGPSDDTELGQLLASGADASQRGAQIEQAQRMMQVGCLSGRIAHDLNNLLTVIEGSAELVADVLPPTHEAQRDLDVIRQASQRSSAMIRQILAFIRQQPLQPFPLHLGELIASSNMLIERVAGGGVAMTTDIAANLWLVMAVRSQLEQILLNLVTNARDAMPDGGQLTIRACNYVEDVGEGKLPAEYVLIEVSDTGVGIAPEVQRHLFDAFYTTKAAGKGTGLGLTICASIIAQLGGRIGVESAVGVGTTIRVLLPRAVV
jgi:two-component system cell cycle sensor histidine kinase/response regulator CckA